MLVADVLLLSGDAAGSATEIHHLSANVIGRAELQREIHQRGGNLVGRGARVHRVDLGDDASNVAGFERVEHAVGGEYQVQGRVVELHRHKVGIRNDIRP